MSIEVIRTRYYVLHVSNQKIKPGDTVMTLANPNSIPYKVRHPQTIKNLHKERRVVVKHQPIDDAPILDGVPVF